MLGDVINESVDKRKEKYIKTMNALADMGESKKSLGLNKKDVEILTPYVFEGIKKFIKSLTKDNSTFSVDSFVIIDTFLIAFFLITLYFTNSLYLIYIISNAA